MKDRLKEAGFRPINIHNVLGPLEKITMCFVVFRTNFLENYKTLIERMSRVPQLQGVQGRSCSRLPRVLGNAEDGVASAFPKGKQNERFFLKL